MRKADTVRGKVRYLAADSREKFSVVPEWFNFLLGEWAREYRGSAVNLGPRSCTQILWDGEPPGFLYSEPERQRVNAAFAGLQQENPSAADMIRFYYLNSSSVIMRDVEVAYGLSNRAAGQQFGAAVSCLYGIFLCLNRAA